MKALLSILISAAALVWAGETPVSPSSAATTSPPSAAIQGDVLEVKDVANYTYLRLKTKDGETWAAVGKAPVKKGAKVTIENVMVVSNFESKSLKQTFKTIAFGTLAGAGAASNAMGMAHSGIGKSADTADMRVPKASGANAWTVAEIITKATDLKDKSVLVRGKVVKYNPGIMGKNWIHLRDGSGSAADNTNDILATTLSEANTGDVVTVKGVVRIDKDFGSGYSYKVLIEEATFQK